MLALLFDTETTGLIDNHTLKIKHQPHIIEFYGCIADLRNGKIKKELQYLIKPPIDIEPMITNITTIDNETVKNSPTIDKVALEIFKFLESSKILIAHNASYDKEIIEIEAERLNQKVKFGRFICTVEQTISLKGFRMTLSDLHQFLFGEPFAGAHRAKVDVMALLRCCVELHKREVL